jgi:Uri superfamily endonuclease
LQPSKFKKRFRLKCVRKRTLNKIASINLFQGVIKKKYLSRNKILLRNYYYFLCAKCTKDKRLRWGRRETTCNSGWWIKKEKIGTEKNKKNAKRIDADTLLIRNKSYWFIDFIWHSNNNSNNADLKGVQLSIGSGCRHTIDTIKWEINVWQKYFDY